MEAVRSPQKVWMKLIWEESVDGPEVEAEAMGMVSESDRGPKTVPR